MNNFVIDNVDFKEIDAEKYWSFPKSYKGNKKEETKVMVNSGNYIGSLKNDGHYARFIKDMNGNMWLQGRTRAVDGEYHNKIEWVPQCQEFFSELPNGTCLLGELYLPNERGSRRVTTILGCLKEKALERQQNEAERLYFYIFDVWAWNGKSYLDTAIENRIVTLNSIETNCNYIHKAQYYKGEELWSELCEILSRGDEGIVMTKIGSKPEPGKRTARKTLKVKMEIENNIDVFIDGEYKAPTRIYGGKELETWHFWENTKTGELTTSNMILEYRSGEPWEPVTKAYFYGWASAVSISVMKDGKPLHIGYISGIPDEMKENIIKNPDIYKNKVYEVSCMEIEVKGDSYSLRHGKFIQARPDKNYLDCDFSQLSN